MNDAAKSPLVDTHGRLLKERFSALPASALVACPSSVIDTTGVYAILLLDADVVLARIGYNTGVDGKLWSIGKYGHVYTGEGAGVCGRLLDHLSGTVRDSTFRESLIALQAATGAIWDNSDPLHADLIAEEILTEWLSEKALVAFKHCNLIGEVERDLLQRSPSPLNIKDRPRTPFTDLLSRARAQHGVPRKPSSPSPQRRAERERPYLLHHW